MSFFARRVTQDALDTLATTTPLTIFVGAGASADAGLGRWEDVVKGLLHKAARLRDLPQEMWEPFSDSIIADFGLPTAATIAQAVLKRETLENTVRECLYEELDYTTQPGTFAANVALLAALGDNCPLMTLNYDDLLEQALHNNGLTSQPITGPDQNPACDVPVIHLHGFRPADGRRAGELVIGEADYILMQESTNWQESVCTNRLMSDSCLFLGMSLRDPNLLRYLYWAARNGGEAVRKSAEKKHYALFALQAEQELASAIRTARRRVINSRWEDIGVIPLECDYLGQAAQFVHEIVLRKRLGEMYPAHNFDNRMAQWRSRMDAQKLQSRSTREFEVSQRGLHHTLRKLIDDIERLLGHRADDEHFAAHVWVCDPDADTLECWGSSVQVVSKSFALARQPIELPNDYVAVESYCTGRRIGEKRSMPRSRWTFVMATTIYLKDDGPWFHLPVGVVTLSSDSRESSILSELRGDELNRIWKAMDLCGEELLRP